VEADVGDLLPSQGSKSLPVQQNLDSRQRFEQRPFCPSMIPSARLLLGQREQASTERDKDSKLLGPRLEDLLEASDRFLVDAELGLDVADHKGDEPVVGLELLGSSKGLKGGGLLAGLGVSFREAEPGRDVIRFGTEGDLEVVDGFGMRVSSLIK
jgi:hypothetical protein